MIIGWQVLLKQCKHLHEGWKVEFVKIQWFEKVFAPFLVCWDWHRWRLGARCPHLRNRYKCESLFPIPDQLSPSHPHSRHWYGCRGRQEPSCTGRSRNRSRDRLGPCHPHLGNWNGCTERLDHSYPGNRATDLVRPAEDMQMDLGWETTVSAQGAKHLVTRWCSTTEETLILEKSWLHSKKTVSEVLSSAGHFVFIDLWLSLMLHRLITITLKVI